LYEGVEPETQTEDPQRTEAQGKGSDEKKGDAMTDEFKTCWSCRWFDFDPGCGDYSELTPGDDMEICCRVYNRPGGPETGHFHETGYVEEKKFRECIEKAKTCHDFEKRES